MQYEPRDSRRRRRSRRNLVRFLRVLPILLGICLAAFGLIRLIGYGADRSASRRTVQELRDVYYAEATAETAAETPAPGVPAAPDEAGEPAAVPGLPAETAAHEPEGVSGQTANAAPQQETVPGPAESAAPVPEQIPAPAGRLQAVPYPGNPGRNISSRFRALQKESRYIIGWLNIGAMLDQPVVQRDDTFYMDHDARGNPNANGAIFLDALTSLKTRPYTYTLYGHNMKSGEMFGCLRNFEKNSFYKNYPFISFDTMYEDGRYVIFAVSTVSTDEQDGNYADLYELRSYDPAARQAVIDTLISASVHTCPIDVRPDDQLLLLVTCVEKDAERRLVAARRVREGESEEYLKQLAERSRKK